MVDKKELDKSISKQAVLSFLVFLALYFGHRFLSGESIETDGFVLGFSIFIALIIFARNVLSDWLVDEFEDEAKTRSSHESTVEG